MSIDGREAPIDSWTPSLIVVQPAAKDNGSVGEVLVSVRDHESNRAMLSEWRGPFTTVARGPGSLKATIVHDLRFRADVRATRAQIHEPPDFTVGLGDMLGSRVRWECTGKDVVISGDTTSTTTWSGSQGSTEIPFDHTLPVSTNPGPSLTLFTLPGMDDATCISTLVVESPEKTETIESELQLLQFTAQNENVEILIGEDWQLLGQTRDPVTTGSGEVVQLSFPEIPNNFPPDPDQGR